MAAELGERREWLHAQEERLHHDELGRAERSRQSVLRQAGTGSARPHNWSERHVASRILHVVGDVAAHSLAGVLTACLVLAWIGVGLATQFPDWWETVLYSAAAAVTVVMVFVIQHTTTRQTAATQRKLDELIRATAGADDGVIAVEEASDEQLQALADLNRADRAESTGAQESDGGGGRESNPLVGMSAGDG